jgi:hypothetical protein
VPTGHWKKKYKVSSKIYQKQRKVKMASSPQQQQSFMPSPSPLVWYLLLDSATGKPFKGTTVSSVLRSSLVVPVVDQFRKAVQAQYDKPNFLKDIPSGALLVYKNKAAFDKRNAAVDEGKEEPLEEDSFIESLGTSKKEALVVVVPSSLIGKFFKKNINDPINNGASMGSLTEEHSHEEGPYLSNRTAHSERVHMNWNLQRSSQILKAQAEFKFMQVSWNAGLNFVRIISETEVPDMLSNPSYRFFHSESAVRLTTIEQMNSVSGNIFVFCNESPPSSRVANPLSSSLREGKIDQFLNRDEVNRLSELLFECCGIGLQAFKGTPAKSDLNTYSQRAKNVVLYHYPSQGPGMLLFGLDQGIRFTNSSWVSEVASLRNIKVLLGPSGGGKTRRTLEAALDQEAIYCEMDNWERTPDLSEAITKLPSTGPALELHSCYPLIGRFYLCRMLILYLMRRNPNYKKLDFLVVQLCFNSNRSLLVEKHQKTFHALADHMRKIYRLISQYFVCNLQACISSFVNDYLKMDNGMLVIIDEAQELDKISKNKILSVKKEWRSAISCLVYSNEMYCIRTVLTGTSSVMLLALKKAIASKIGENIAPYDDTFIEIGDFLLTESDREKILSALFESIDFRLFQCAELLVRPRFFVLFLVKLLVSVQRKDVTSSEFYTNTIQDYMHEITDDSSMKRNMYQMLRKHVEESPLILQFLEELIISYYTKDGRVTLTERTPAVVLCLLNSGVIPVKLDRFAGFNNACIMEPLLVMAIENVVCRTLDDKIKCILAEMNRNKSSPATLGTLFEILTAFALSRESALNLCMNNVHVAGKEHVPSEAKSLLRDGLKGIYGKPLRVINLRALGMKVNDWMTSYAGFNPTSVYIIPTDQERCDGILLAPNHSSNTWTFVLQTKLYNKPLSEGELVNAFQSLRVSNLQTSYGNTQVVKVVVAYPDFNSKIDALPSRMFKCENESRYVALITGEEDLVQLFGKDTWNALRELKE